MMIFPMQPRVQHAILFRLIFLFLGGVTSGTIIYINEYNSTDPIEIGQDVMFTGTLNDTITPLGVSCYVNISNSSTPIKICDINARNCNGSANITCNCERQDGSIYHIVIKDPAKLERSYASFYCVGSVGSPSPLQTYPEIKEPHETGMNPVLFFDVTTDTSTSIITTLAQNTTRAPTTVTSTTITITPGTTKRTETTPEDQPENRLQLIRSVTIFLLIILVSVFFINFVAYALDKKRIKEDKEEAKGDDQTDQVEKDASPETGQSGDLVASDSPRESLSTPVDLPTFVSWSGH